MPARPVLSNAGRIEWEKSGQCLPLVLACIHNGLQLNVAQTRKLLKHFQVTVPPNLNKGSLQQLLVSTFLDKEEDQKKAMQQFDVGSKDDDTLDSELEDVVSCLDDEDANPLDLKELKEKKRLKRYQKHGNPAAAGRQQVPDRQKKTGKGKGRGRGRKGRGRGRPALRKTIFKNRGKGNPPAPPQLDTVPNATGDADSEVPSPSPPPCDHSEPAEVGTLPPSSPEAAPPNSEQLASPGTLPPSHSPEVPAPHGEVPSSSGDQNVQPSTLPEGLAQEVFPPAGQIVETGTLPEDLAQEVLPPPGDHPLPDGAQPSLPAAPATPVQAPEHSSSSSKPVATGVTRPKVYSTPQEAFEDMIPPGAKIILNYNEHRFCTTWVGSSEGVPPELAGKHFTRSFVNKPYEQALAECHERLWEKWSYVKDKHPLPSGKSEQVPGVVPDHVLASVKEALTKLPPLKRYNKKN